MVGLVQEDSFLQDDMQTLRGTLSRLKENEGPLYVHLLRGYKIPEHFWLKDAIINQNVMTSCGDHNKSSLSSPVAENTDETLQSVLLRRSTRVRLPDKKTTTIPVQHATIAKKSNKKIREVKTKQGYGSK